MALEAFLDRIGEEVHDADEGMPKSTTPIELRIFICLLILLESFLLFSRAVPSANLGFVDPRATAVDLTIHDHDFCIQQSPTLLSSARAAGTTGAGKRSSRLSCSCHSLEDSCCHGIAV
jgi:hypothetical protein